MIKNIEKLDVQLSRKLVKFQARAKYNSNYSTSNTHLSTFMDGPNNQSLFSTSQAYGDNPTEESAFDRSPEIKGYKGRLLISRRETQNTRGSMRNKGVR